MTAEEHATPGMVARLADYVCAARDRHLSPEIEEAALRRVLDLFAAAAAGTGDRIAASVRAVAASTMGAGAVPVWFTDQLGSAPAAAWANSAAASALDLDDGHRLARGHPGAAVIPAAFAVAAEIGASLEAVLRAVVVGYEVGVTVGAARTSYGNTGTWSPYAVVAAAAALRGTEAAVIAHALAIAGESAPNQLFASAPAPRTPDPEGSGVKEGIPWSVVTGLLALRLAEAGHTGPRNILDSTRQYRFPDRLALGEAPHIGRSYFKLHACCRHVHAPIEALLAVVAAHGLVPAEITAVEVDTHGGALRITNRTRPANLVDAQYSIPYCLGLVALRGTEALLPLTEAALFQADVSDFADRVALRSAPELDARFPAETLARVTVTHRGSRYQSAVTEPRGEGSAPLGWPELEAKFRAASRFALPPDRQDRVVEAFRAARARVFGPLSALCSLPPPGG